MKIMGYGIVLTAEDIARRQLDAFNYLKALIGAENINPDNAYEYNGEMEQRLLKKIAISGCTQDQRTSLVTLLIGNDKDD